jgi:hypothetical protein
MSEFIVKDSGERQHFNTGAVRDTATEKSRPDLISPFFLERLGHHLRKGAVKYSSWNWAKGIPNSRCYESAMRHLMQFAQGDTDEDHLSAAAFNIMAIIHNQEVAERGIVMADGFDNALNDMPIFVKREDQRVPVGIEKGDYE